MGNATWRVNDFQAAVCITIGEINQKLAEVFAKTDDLPKAWKTHDITVKPGSKPRWSIDVKLGAPTIDFATDLKQGLRLRIPLVSGEFTHMEVELDGDVPVVTWPTIPLAGAEIQIETVMKKVEHTATGTGATVDERFTVQSLYADMESPKLISTIHSERAADFKAVDNTKRTIAGVLLDLFKSDKYKEKWVIGRARIPAVKATTGVLAPTGVRFSTYQEAGTSRGTLNWNLALGGDALPADNDRAGAYAAYPIPGAAKGVLLISWNTVIRSLVAGKALAPFGLKEDDFLFREAQINAGLAKHVAWKLSAAPADDTKQVDGKFTDVTITPDIDQGGVKVQFTLANVVQHPSRDDFRNWQLSNESAAASGSTFSLPPPSSTDPVELKWTSWFKFSFDATGGLVVSYSAGDTASSGEGPSAMRIIRSIVTLGLNELAQYLEVKSMQEAIKQTFGADQRFADVLKAVELPGKAVFKFSAVKATTDGLAISLEYA
jgi:hypothetical protein